jgi:hypothetical protein
VSKDWQMQPVPLDPATHHVDWRSIWDPAMEEVSVSGFGGYRGYGDDATATTVAPTVATNAPAPAAPTSWGSYLFAGLLVGGAAAVFMGAVRGKGGSRATANRRGRR